MNTITAMKKLVLLAVAILLVGCGSNTSSDTDVDSQSVKTVGIGESCGNEIKCKPSLECRREEMTEDSTSVCVETVVDKDVECSQNKAPVCGLKGRNKNGYLNECEAKRHGAEILHEWFCKVEEESKNNCKAQVIGLGNCEMFTVGYEFNGKSCQEVGIAGCEFEIPFDTMKDCKMECL
jgi:hypothetical protein